MTKKQEKAKAKICPRCLMEYTGYPALSRQDNETPICPDCGVSEAMFTRANFHEDRWWLDAKDVDLVEANKHGVGSVKWQDAMLHNVRHKLLNGLDLNSMDTSFLEIQREHTAQLRAKKAEK